MSTDIIAKLNDRLRTAFLGGQIVITAGIAALPPEVQADIVTKVRTFDDFSEDNNPFEEHDFGSFKHDGHTIFWKIDYYTPDLKHGSPDPSDPGVTSRVLTVMLASEY